MVVLGSQLVSNSSGAIVPGTSGSARSAAAAVLYHRFEGRIPIVTSGSYLIGVRYEVVHNTILSPPNSTFAAYAVARNYASEAATFKQYMTDGVSPFVPPVPAASIMVEEVAAGTDENAEVAGGVIGTRLARFTFDKPALCEAVVTNLYHMPRALPYFAQYADNNTATPAFAEDWISLIPPDPKSGLDWIQVMAALYASPVGGVQYNVTLLVEIMGDRRAGNLSRSVAEVLPPQSIEGEQARTAVLVRETVDVVTQAQSLAMAKNLIRTAVGEVLWLRGILPPDSFKELPNGLGGVNVHLLKGEADCDGAAASSGDAHDAAAINAWLEDGVFDALDQGFLRAMILTLYHMAPGADHADLTDENLLEAYIVRVSYPADGQVEVSVTAKRGEFTRDAVARQAITMIRSLVSLVGTLPPLPDGGELLLAVRLYYYDDRIPAHLTSDWAPRHFKDATEMAPLTFSAAPVKLPAGTTSSGHHRVELNVAINRDRVTTPADSEPVVSGLSETTADEGDEALEKLLEAVKIDVQATGDASRSRLRRAFATEAGASTLERVLVELAKRGVLTRSSGRGPATYAVVAAPATTAKAPVARGNGGDKSLGADDQARRLLCMATLVANSQVGGFISSVLLSRELQLSRKDRDVSRQLVDKLVERRLVDRESVNGRGHPVRSSQVLHDAVTSARTWLQAHDPAALRLVEPPRSSIPEQTRDTPRLLPRERVVVEQRRAPKRAATHARPRDDGSSSEASTDTSQDSAGDSSDDDSDDDDDSDEEDDAVVRSSRASRRGKQLSSPKRLRRAAPKTAAGPASVDLVVKKPANHTVTDCKGQSLTSPQGVRPALVGKAARKLGAVQRTPGGDDSDREHSESPWAF